MVLFGVDSVAYTIEAQSESLVLEKRSRSHF
jgi:hypothetical protein